jgi:CHAD domain-containing protein
MQNENYLYRIYREYSRTYMSYMKSTLESCSEEDIHQIRVSTKRIKALFELFLSIMPAHSFTKKYFAIYSTIFSKSGNVRNIQIVQNILDNIEIDVPFAFKRYLENKLEYDKKEMLANIEKFDKQKLYRQNSSLYKKLRYINDSGTLVKSFLLLSSNLHEGYDLFNVNYELIKLHKIRKKLRSSGEILKVIYEIEPEDRINELFSKLKEIRDILGFWHDYEIMSEYVLKFEKENDDFLDQIKYLIDHIDLEKGYLKNKAVDMLNIFYQNDLSEILKKR